MDTKNKEIESLRAMMQQTQSLRGTDPRQADDLRRNIQQLQSENQQLRQENQQLQSQSQQIIQGYNQQGSFELQQRILQLQNDLNNAKLMFEMQQKQLQNKENDYNQLKLRVQARDFINSIPPGQEQNRLLVLQRENQRLNEIINQKESLLESLRIRVDEQDVSIQEKDYLSKQLREYEEKIVLLSREIENLLTVVGGLRHDVLLKTEFDKVKLNLQQSERECREWKEKYQRLEYDSHHLVDLEKQKAELEDRINKLQEENDKLELENRGMQLRQQAFDRLLKEKENLQQKLQEMDAQIGDLERQQSEKRRENETLKRQAREKDEDFLNFKENIYRPCEDRIKRLELDVENWRNKCLALENNFFGNNERFYVENEFRRLHGVILGLQQENEELKVKMRTMRQSNIGGPSENVNEERTKLLYAERERLFGEIEQLRKRNIQLEQEVGIVKSQNISPQMISNIPQIQIIQEGGQNGASLEDLRNKDRQLEELKQGVETLIDENKGLKQEIDNLQMQVEQLEIDKSYLIQRQQLNPKENNLDMLARLIQQQGESDLNPKYRVLEELARRQNESLQQKEIELQQLKSGLGNNQKQLIDQLQMKDEQIKQLSRQVAFNQDQSIQSKYFDQSPQGRQHVEGIQQLLEQQQQENHKLRRQINELHSKKDNEFFALIEQKDRHIDAMRRKYAELQQGEPIQNDVKKLKDMLEQKSYEVQEWKDKFQLIQSQLRNKENMAYGDIVRGNSALEQEYRRIRQLLEFKTIEAEEYKQRLTNNKQDTNVFSQDTESQLRKLKQLLELRSAECEDWRQKYLQSQQTGISTDQKDDIIRRHQQMLEAKHRECEELRNKYGDVLRNKDKGMASHIEDLQNEVRKHQRMHEAKSQELLDIQPRIQQVAEAQKDRNILMNELKRVKQVLEQQIIENEQLKRKLNSAGSSIPNGLTDDKGMYERQIRDYQQKIQQLQSEIQKANLQMKDKHWENDKLKQTYIVHQEQIKSIAIGNQATDQKNRDLQEQYLQVKSALQDKMKENDEFKKQLNNLQQILQNLQRENQELKRGGDKLGDAKVQAQIMQSKMQDLNQKNQQLQDQMNKHGKIIQDKMQENEKLKQNLQKVDQYKREKDQIVQQLQQLKENLQARQKENEQLRGTIMQQQKKIQELSQVAEEHKKNQEKFKNLMADMTGKFK